MINFLHYSVNIQLQNKENMHALCLNIKKESYSCYAPNCPLKFIMIQF